MALSSGGDLTGLKLAFHIRGRNKLLTRFTPAPISNKFAAVLGIPAVIPIEIRAL